MRARLDRWVQTVRNRPRWLRVTSRVVGLMLIIASLYYLAHTLQVGLGQTDWRSLELAPGPLLLSLAVSTLCVFAGGWAWQLILKAFGHTLPLSACLGIQTTSNLAKYIPGYAWQLLGKAYLTRREEVPTGIVATAMALELATLLLTGALVGLAFMPTSAVLPLFGQLPAWLPSALAGALALFLLLLPLLLRRLAASPLGQRFQLGALGSPVFLWSALAIMVGAWVALGIGLTLLIQALQPFPWAQSPWSIYVMALSLLVSLLALFVPSGLGVREGMMVYGLGACLPANVAVVVAVLARLVSIVGELVAFVLYWLYKSARTIIS